MLRSQLMGLGEMGTSVHMGALVSMDAYCTAHSTAQRSTVLHCAALRCMDACQAVWMGVRLIHPHLRKYLPAHSSVHHHGMHARMHLATHGLDACPKSTTLNRQAGSCCDGTARESGQVTVMLAGRMSLWNTRATCRGKRGPRQCHAARSARWIEVQAGAAHWSFQHGA